MHNWFECKVKYDKTAEEGKVITASETYLVDALSFTEAEERIIEEMTPFISGEFTVANIRRIKISEMFPNDADFADKWYRCKVVFVLPDEEKGIEKRTAVAMYVQAGDLKSACDSLIEGMKGSLADYEIASVIETAIIDVYLYNAEKAAKEDNEE